MVDKLNTKPLISISSAHPILTIFLPAAPQKWGKKSKFKKIPLSPLDTPKMHLWSKFEVSRAILASDLTYGVILRYCAICAQNAFCTFFDKNRVKKSGFALYGCINVGFCV